MQLFDQHTCIYTHTHTRTYAHTHTHGPAHIRTPPCSMMSGRRMPLYMQRQLCRYIRAAASVPLCMKRQLYRYRHAAATAATHKRSHSCKHSFFHQERLLDSSALDGRSCSLSRRLRPVLDAQVQKGDLAANGASYIIRLVLELKPFTVHTEFVHQHRLHFNDRFSPL